jgi:tetratricopeptide (TPR) repeat protein
MDDDNSYLVDYELGPAPKDSWFAGHRWAEPSVKSLRRAMRRVYEDRAEAAAIGERGRSDVLQRCSPELLADAVRDRLEAIDRHPIHVSLASAARLDQPSGPTAVHRRKRSGRLTACVVVADEDAVPSVEQCLASVGGVADSEVVVEAGARGDMGAVRNEALDQASGGWVLMLDATQTLDPASVDVVAELVDRNRFVGYTARERRQVGLDGAVSAVAARTVCLFPRRPDLRYVGRVGEQLVGRQSELRFRVTPSSIVVHQHRRGDDLDPVALARRQLPVLEQTRRDEPDEPFHRYNLGVALDRLGLHAEAERELRTAIDLAPPHAVWSAPAHAGLSRAVREQQRSEEAVALAKQATKLDPDWAQGWALLGTTLADAGRSKAALRAYTRALDCLDETALAANDPDDVAVAVRAGMGRIHLARGEYGEAMSVLRGAIALHPSSARLRVEIAQAHAAMGQTSAALGQLERAAELERGAPDAFIGISDFFTRRAEEALLRGLAGNPESGALLERIERLRAARAVF